MKWQGPRSKSEPQRISLMMADDDGTSSVARIASRRGRYCDKSALWWLKPWSQQCQLHSHKYTAIWALNIALFLYKEIWCTLHIPHRTITYILVYCEHDAMKSLSTTLELRYIYHFKSLQFTTLVSESSALLRNVLLSAIHQMLSTMTTPDHDNAKQQMHCNAMHYCPIHCS